MIARIGTAVYAAANADDHTYLARGKLGSSSNHKKWETSDPKGLLTAIDDRFANSNERLQFKRVIKYLKRWKDLQFSSEGNEAPRGIALTACAYQWFSPKIYQDVIANTSTEDDLDALLQLVVQILSRFSGSRLSVTLPVPPGNDLFERMTDAQMRTMKAKLQELRNCLTEAQDEVDPHDAAQSVADILGDDFPVPEKKDTGVKKAAAIVNSGHSG